MKDKAELYERVKWLKEPEFGDFKRKVSLYIDQFREQKNLDQGLRKTLADLKHQVVYAPSGDIEATRRMVLQKLKSDR